MESRIIQDVCPELEYEKGLGIYHDADRVYIWLNPCKAHIRKLNFIVKKQ